MVERFTGSAFDPQGSMVRHSDYAALERQIAELRAERDALSVHLDMTHSEKIAAEAENARLRALPFKDEVERVLEEMLFLAEAEHMCLLAWNQSGSAANYDGITERARTLLSHLQAGEHGGHWREIETNFQIKGRRRSPAYFPATGEECEVSGPNCDDANGYTWATTTVLWQNDIFVLYGQPEFWPVLHKHEHVLFRPLSAKEGR